MRKTNKTKVGSEVKASASDAGDPGSIPGLGRPPGEGNGNPFQYSCLGNSMDRGTWWATVHEVAKDPDRTEQLKNNKEDSSLLAGEGFGFGEIRA